MFTNDLDMIIFRQFSFQIILSFKHLTKFVFIFIFFIHALPLNFQEMTKRLLIAVKIHPQGSTYTQLLSLTTSIEASGFNKKSSSENLSKNISTDGNIVQPANCNAA
jgi:hypothetical protein